MIINNIFKNILAILFLCGFSFSQQIGFVDIDGDGSYSKSYAESVDGDIQIEVTNNDGNTSVFTFWINVDYTTNVSTSKRREGSNTAYYGRGYYRDWVVNSLGTNGNWSGSNDLATDDIKLGLTKKEDDDTYAVNRLRYYVQATAEGNGIYTITLDILDDKMYEPGGAETIEFYLDGANDVTITGGKTRFTYQIADNDLEPYYGFKNNADQTYAEGTNFDGLYNTGTQVQPLANPADGVVYVQGHVDFVFTYSVSNTDEGTTSADYTASNTTITIQEWNGGSDNSGNVVENRYWNYRNLDLRIVNDAIHEPDEAFSVTLGTSDSDGNISGTDNSKKITIENDTNDDPPYVKFVNASQYVDEAAGNTTISLDFYLSAASGFANPSVGYNVTGGTAEGPTDPYKDYSLTNGVVIFDGDLGDRAQTVTFTLYADTYDEGADNDNDDYETVIIELDATNATNTRVDNTAYPNTTHEVRIRDNDPTPLIAFSTDAAVTATSGDEDASGPPVIKVVIVDSDGNSAPSEKEIKMTFENNATGTATIYNSASPTTPWDYKINNATEVTLAAYAQEQAINITINNDAFYEGNETIKFNAIAGDNVGGGTITGTFTINDDETVPKIYFTESASIITSTETGDDPLPKSIEVKLTGMTAHPVDFSYSVSSLNAGGYLTNSIDDDFDNSSSPDEAGEGSAVENTDFTLGGVTTGTISAVTSTEDTESKTTLTFTHNVDKTDELDKFVQLTVAPGGSETHATAATDGSQNQVIKLVDDDEPIQLSYTESTIDDVSEGTATTITVKKLTDSANPGPAQNNGTNKTEFTVNGIISIGDPDNAATNIDGAGDDDFNLATSGGDAIAAGATHSFSIGPDADDASITITTIDDELYEGGTSGTDEVVLFELAMANDSNGDPQVGAVVAQNTTLTYSIKDNDDKPVITFDTDNTVTSGNENTLGTPQIQIKQDRRSKFASSINYTVTPENALVVPGTGGDYILATPGVAAISALATTATIDLNIEPDTKYENDETVTIALTTIPANVEATAGTANMSTDYVITNDDDKPKINFELSATNQLEDDGSVTLKVSLSSISGVSSTVDYAITGTATKTGDDRDFDDETTSDNAGVLSWDADVDQDQLIKITPRSDNIDEATETIIITLSNPTGGATTTGSSKLVHTINLIDSDSPPPLGFALEEDTPANNTAHEESTDLITPSVVMATGYSSDFDISIIWSIDTDNTTAVIDGVANEDFEIRDASNAALANYEGLNDAARTVTLLAGESSVNLPSFLFPKDDLYELEEVLILKIATPTSVSGLDGSGNLISANGSFITSSGGNTQDTKTITIANAPTETMPQASITTTGEGNEAETTTNFIVTLSAKNGGASKAGVDLYVDYAIGSVVSGRDAAEELTDYVLPDADGSRTVTINAYESTATKTINLLNDVIYEYDEDIVLNLVTSSGNAANQRSIVADSPNETYTYTITETDDMPIVEFADADNAIAVDEDGTAAESIVLQFKSGGTQKAEMDVHAYLSVDTDNSTALNGTDFGSSSNALAFTDNKKVTISADASTEPFDFYAKDDNRYEAEQTAIFNLSTYAANELPSGVTDISNATSAAGEKLTITINASGEDEKPVVKWVDKDEDLVNSRYPATDTDGRPVAENDGPAYFTLQLDKYSEKEIVVNYSLIESANVSASPPNIVATLGASNSYPTDFNAWGAGTDGVGSSSALIDKAGSVTFTALGNSVETNQYVNIQAVFVDDNVNEWSETIVLSIDTDGNSDVTGTGESDKIFITNDDAVPRIGFDALGSGDGDADPKEEALSNSSPSFTIELTDAAANGTVTGKDLYFSIVTNSANNSDITVATPTSDFTAISDTEDDWIKISAATDLNAQTQSFNLVIIDDAVDEEDQKVTLTLGVKGADFNGGKSFTGTIEGFEETAADAATIVSGGGVHTFTIQDDDPEPTAYFYEENPSNTNSNAETQSVFEKYNEESITGVKTIKVKTLGDSEKNITLYYSILTTGCVSAGGCATAGHDYTAIDDNTVLSILPSDNNEKTFSVSTLDDDRDEFAQDIIIQLSSNSESNATVGSSDANPGKYFLIIEDKDPEPEVDFKLATRDQLENVPNGKSTIELSRHTEKNVVIGYETSSNEADFGIFVVNDLDDNNGSVTWPEDIDMTFEKTTISINGLAGDVANGDPMKAEIPTVLGTDTNDEWDEKFKIQIDAETSENVDKGSTNPETIITIQDNDEPEIVEFASNPASGSNTEGNNTYNLEFLILEPSGKDIEIKYSITSDDNPNDKDHATKNIDYNFGGGVTTNANGDSILIIRSESFTQNIPLTIIDDDIYEENQLIKIRISLANTYSNDDADYYNSASDVAGVEAVLGDRDLYIHTITDNEVDPIVHFSSDVSAVEGSATPLGIETISVPISLKDAAGNLVESEKSVVVPYVFDTDNSTASKDIAPADKNKYEDDFDLTDAALTFSPITYTYNSVSDSYSKNEGENPKSITLDIYNDDLYELDETIIINLTEGGFENAATDGGDHSFTYTLQNDDTRPIPNWVDNYSIDEANPSDVNADSYTNSDVKISLDRESGTDIFIQYSQKDLDEDDVYDAAIITDDFNLDEDDAVINTAGKKSVTIPAATSATSDLFKTLDIEILNDNTVEQDEKFILQIDNYRDKNAAGSLVANATTNGITKREATILLKDNDLGPDTLDIQSVLTLASDSDKENAAAGHWNPVTAGYWNSYNTGLSIVVPFVDWHNSLENGKIVLQALVSYDDGASYVAYDIGDAEKIITSADITAGSITFEITAAKFEEGDWFVEGNRVYFRANILDKYTPANSTIGEFAATTIVIDETLPTQNNHTIESVVSKSGNEIADKWNGTNESIEAAVKFQSVKDLSVDNGSLMLFCGVGDNSATAAYDTLGSAVSISSSDNEVGKSITFTIPKNDVELQTDFGQNRIMNFKVEVVDVAGNKLTLPVADNKLFIDTAKPTIVSVESVLKEDYNVIKNGLFGIDDSVYIKVKFSETISITEGDASLVLGVASQPSILNTNLINVDSVVAIYAVAVGESSDSLSFSSINIINNGAALRDVAGNDMATDFNVPDGSSLKQTSAVQIDGIYPEDFTISNIWIDGSNIVDGYWNSTSTRLIVRVREYTSAEDTTLIDGTVQLKMRVYTNNNTTPGATWLNLGDATTLNNQNQEPGGIWVEGGTRLYYSQISNRALHFAIEASVLEDITGFPDLNANPQPEQNILIDFNAVITDKAGNAKLGTSAAQLTVDEVEPLDPKDGLPSGTYSYQFPGGVTFDNYLDVTSEYDQSGTGYSRSGYYNSTNNGITFKSWIGFDDLVNANVTIDRDASLVDGYVQVLMSSVTDLNINNWKAVGDSVVITTNDINSNDTAFVNVFVHDTSLIANSTDIFKENRTVYFRNKVTDAAGNSIYQDAISSHTILVDETAHSAADLLYSRKYINTDSVAIVELTFPSDDPPFGLPKLSATFKATPAEPVVDKLMSDTLANNYTFYYNLDIPGSLNDPAYDDTVAISIDATDLAGNPLPVDSLNNSKYLIVDNMPPKVWFQYTNTDNEVVNDPGSVVPDSLDMAKGGDIVQIIAHLTEPMWKTDDVIATNEVLKPSLSMRTSSNTLLSVDYDSIDGTYNELDSTIIFNVEMPSTVAGSINDYEGRLMMYINGVDLAVNTIQPIDFDINNDNQDAYTISPDPDSAHVRWNSFKLDNRNPSFRVSDVINPDSAVVDNNFYNFLKFGWELTEQISSGSIKFIPVSNSSSEVSVDLDATELGTEFPPNTLVNQTDLLAGLSTAYGDSNTYNIVYEGYDYVGNIGQDTIKNVMFDTKKPTAQIFYETEYITSLSPKVGTVIRVTFNEVQSSAPDLKLFYGVSSTVAQNATEDVGGTVQGVTWNTATVDISDPLKIEEITMDSTSEALPNRVWYYEIDSNEVKENIPGGIQWDGYVWADLTSTDRAGNSIDGLQYNHFDNFLYLDNIEPTATITYTNLRDSTLTITEVVNGDELTNCCFAIYEDTVLVKVEMNELIKNDPTNPPTISGVYNKDNVGVGSVFSNVQPIIHPDNIDSTDQTSLVLHYKVVIADSVKNNGPIDITFNAVDKAGTSVGTYGLSSQKSGIFSNVALEVDNIHPWGFSENLIFSEETVLTDVTFPTDSSWTSVKSTFAKVVDGWINAETDSIYIRIPHHRKVNDSTLYAPYQSSDPGWGPQGILDMQVQNLDIGLQWITVGQPDTITTTVPGGGIDDFNSYTYSRIISRPVDSLIFGVHLNQGVTALNKLRIRARITDRNGNITNGQPSDMYEGSGSSLYALDLASTDTIRYDVAIPVAPTPVEFRAVAGTFYPNDQDTAIISSDKVSIVWNPFVDPGEGAGSGIDQYEFQVYVYDSTWTPTTELDHVNVIDSLITVDINQDGFVDEGYWYPLDAALIPDIDNPFEMNLADTIVNNIEYDINDTLKHKYYYRINVRSIDVAGNPSGTIFSNWMRRLNSSPIFNELSITTQDLYEDVAWDYDTLKVSDLDLSTNQGDSFTYFITTWLGSDTTGKKLTINPPLVDQSSGLISWKPIQEIRVDENGLDTLVDQQGEHTFRFIVRDDYYEPGFHLPDTLILSLIVTEVNDTPVVAITGEDLLLEWEEDSGEEKEINLTSYVTDIDHLSSSMFWTYEIMDTSQLDEDFPTVMMLPSDNKKGYEKSSLDHGMLINSLNNKSFSLDMLASRSASGLLFSETAADTLIIVTIDSTSTENITIAKIRSTKDYHGQNHRILFFAKDPAGAIDVDTIIVNITPKNDVPIIAAELDTFVINENDSIWIDFADYTSDVDDSTLTFTIQGLSNTDSINYVSEPYISNDPGDSVLFRPFDLFSGEAKFNLTVEDGDESVQKDFLLDVRRVPRPYLDVSLVQNNAFSSYLNIIIIDTAQKTISLQLEVQNQRVDIDTVAAYTYTGDFSFGIQGGYSFDIIAIAKVGKTIYTNTYNLAPARVAERWIASSPDGRLNIIGQPGSVNSDQNFLIVDSSLFINSFTDQASYVLGDELFSFNNPVEVQFGSNRDDLAIYQRQNGVVWKELPSVKRNNQIFTFTKNTGYFRLGPKTMIVPEMTDLHQNYPNPFNPVTTIKYDIGLLDGIEQKISVNVYNIMGQHVTTLINNVSQAGQFSVKWQGDDKLGKMVPSGIYFVQLKTASGIIRNKKMMLLK